MEIIHHYNSDHNVTSAKEVVPFLISLLKPKSVIDIGCGVAQWLKILEEQGVKRILGVDGPHVPSNKINISPDNFIFDDLRKPKNLNFDSKFDMCLCLEVAEHLEPEYASSFVSLLTSVSDKIVFSAAIPNQTGENHYNEQFPHYWQQKFHNQGFVMLDPFRAKFWKNENINWWYRQNMFLFVHSSQEQLIQSIPLFDGNVYIHPNLLELHAMKLKSDNYYLNPLKYLFKKIRK